MRHFVQGVKVARTVRLSALVVACVALASCSASKIDPKYGVSASPRVVQLGEPVPKGGGSYRVGKPYTVAGRTYVPENDVNYRAEGIASWYGTDFHGRLTANGEIFDMQSISAAHPTLPLPSYVRVTNLANKRSLIVRVNDRGPFAHNRIIDLSLKSAQLLGFHARGLAKVRVEYVGRAPLTGSDDRQLIATLREGDAAPAPSAVRVASARPFLPDSLSQPAAVAQKTMASGQAGALLPEEAPGRVDLTRMNAPAVARPTVERGVKIETADLPIAHRGWMNPDMAKTPAPSAVSAFAPTRYDAPAAFLSGRGLY
jgi:rare lipoprotein A